MSIERMVFKGQLAELKKKFKSLDTEASGYIILIRSLLNPYEEDVTKLEVDKSAQSMARLNSIVLEMQALKSKIQRMEADLE